MAAPLHEYAFDLRIARAAAVRFKAEGNPKLKLERALERGRYASLDTPERLALRANRLIEQLPSVATRRGIDARAATGEVSARDVSDRMFERVIGESRDFVFVDFLERAQLASRAVARIVTELGNGRVQYGTGFMVSSRLLLTNHHVLASAAEAGRSRAEFDFERELDGRPRAVSSFALRPGEFFLNDKAHDFALVAVATRGDRLPLGDYGWCPLIRAEGKIVVGEPVNIVQHPKGELKQIALRENRLLAIKDRFAHYEADTEPGSSGSPVFNNQWEVVALHHSGVPKTNARGELLDVDGKLWRDGDDPSRLAWVANEGLRVSRLVAFIERASLPASQAALRRELLEARPAPAMSPSSRPALRPEHADAATAGPRPLRGQPGGVAMPDGDQLLTIELPLRISLRVADGAVGVTMIGADAAVRPAAASGDGVDVVAGGGGATGDLDIEAIEPDPEDPQYLRRPGFDRKKLGFTLPFPRLGAPNRAAAFKLPGVTGERRFELKYHHYSVVFNAQRRIAFFAATNFDPQAPVQLTRDSTDRWFFDPRVPEKLQAGEPLYAGNPLDRGHLVRRADAAWGSDEREARLANDDTFHFTNCSPQHEITNRGLLGQAPPGLRLWGRLEEHVSRQSHRNERAIAIFSGPVFASNDRRYRGVRLPKSFWKLLVFADDMGRPSAAAFVLTQAELIRGLQEEFEVGEYRAVQLRVSELERKLGIDFGRVAGWDVLARPGAEEAFTDEAGVVLLEDLDDVLI